MLTSIEKYEILGEIGRGGMATVYRARDRRLQRLVALKVMHPHLQGAQEARARFAREALTIARLRHPGLLEIFDYSGEDSEVCYIATELLTGPTVKRFIEARPEIPAEMAACIALQVANALAAAHAEGVIHRDVKPENVMFHGGRVKLTDFGIAQLVDVQGMTTTGQVLGSPGHMAPEQIEGRECTPCTDVFALGTVLYQLATSQPPFPGRNPHQILKLMIEGSFRDPLQVQPSIGARLGRIIVRCLATDPAGRYPSAEALSQDLSDFLTEGGIEDGPGRLADYLRDPEGFATAFRKEVIERQALLGERAQAAGRYPEALEHWNRALALDEANPRVLAAVQHLGRRTRHRKLVGLTASVLLCLASLGLVTQYENAHRPDRLPAVAIVATAARPQATAARPQATAAPDKEPASAGAMPPPDSTPVRPPEGTSQSDPGPAAGPPPVQAAGAAADHRRARAARPAKRSTTTPRRAENSAGADRTVIFSPTPVNVSISVDGDRPRPFGPSFRETQLAPGLHRFRFVGAHDCCLDAEFTRTIEPGTEPLIVARKLEFRPAGLYIVTRTPANVSVDGGAAKGRTRSVIDVPHVDALLEAHTVRVTAPGYKPHVQQIQLRAGQVRTLKLDLVQRTLAAQ